MMDETHDSRPGSSAGFHNIDLGLGPPIVLGSLDPVFESPAKIPSAAPPAVPSAEEPRVQLFNPATMGGALHAPPVMPPVPQPAFAPPIAQPPLTPAPASSVAPPQSPMAHSLLSPPASAVKESQASRAASLPPQCHWFYMHLSGGWVPFSKADSDALEKAALSGAETITTDGGRYDVDVKNRTRTPVYWAQKANTVRRGTWYHGQDEYLTPFPEHQAALLEKSFQECRESGQWKQRVDLDNGDLVVLRNELLFVYYEQGSAMWPELPEPRVARRGTYEDTPRTDEPGEGSDSKPIDHLFLLVPGPVPEHPTLSSLNFKGAGARVGSIVDVADNIRVLSAGLIAEHFQLSETSRSSGRVEVLPVLWESIFLRNDIQDNVKTVSLTTNKSHRNFFNESVLDMQSYALEPQSVVDAVGQQINTLMTTFRERNPDFAGGVSIIGHGVGGVIAFDILAHQNQTQEVSKTPAATTATHTDQQQPEGAEVPEAEVPEEECDVSDSAADGVPTAVPEPTLEEILQSVGLGEMLPKLVAEDIDLVALESLSDSDFKALEINMGKKAKLKAAIAKIDETRKKVIEEAEKAAEEKKRRREQATAERRLAQRQRAAEAAERAARAAEASLAAAQHSSRGTQFPKLLISPANLFLIGSPLGLISLLRKQGVGNGGSNEGGDVFLTPDFHLGAHTHVYNIFHPNDPLAYRLEPLVDPSLPAGTPPVLVPHHQGRKRIHLEMKGYIAKAGSDLKAEVKSIASSAWGMFNKALKGATGAVSQQAQASPPATPEASPLDEPVPTIDVVPTSEAETIIVGKLNHGKRIDHVLQEAATEVGGLFFVNSHTSYWTSEDATLFILNRIYTPGN